jgi:hypothetical protein
MAYTGTDPDGGIGYVSKDDPDPKEYIKSRLRNIVKKATDIFNSSSRQDSNKKE